MKTKVFWQWLKNSTEETETTDASTGRTLYLNGVIATEGWFDDDVTPKMFKDELESGSGDIEVWLDSPGGDVMAATQIYNMLKSYKGKVTVKIDSLAASAASVIAMAGDVVLMSPLSLLFIHNPLTVAAGNADDMQKAIDMLETWLSAKKAVELGFADSIMFSDNDADTDDSYEFSQREVSNRLMNQLIKKNTPTAGVKISDLQTRLNLLK